MPPRKTSDGVAAATSTALKPARRPAPRALSLEYVEALKAYADLLYKGGLCPTSKKGPPPRPETVAAIIECGRDVGLSPTQALASIKIVGGRPSMYGDAPLALVRSSGFLEWIKEYFEGEEGEDDWTAVCVVKRVGAEEVTSRFSVADAKVGKLWGSEGPWTTSPKRMLTFRARGFILRDEFTDVLCGLAIGEEQEDIERAAGRKVGQEGDTAARVEVPVQVVSVTADVPSGQAMIGEPTAPPTAAVTPLADPASAPAIAAEADDSGPLTPEQVEQITELYHAECVSRQLTVSADQRKMWVEVLKPYGVDSAKKMTRAVAAKFIADLGPRHDPFTHGPGKGSAPAT